LLRRGGPLVRALLATGKHVLELHHARVHEQERRIVGRHQARSAHDRVAVGLEKPEELVANLSALHCDRQRAYACSRLRFADSQEPSRSARGKRWRRGGYQRWQIDAIAATAGCWAPATRARCAKPERPKRTISAPAAGRSQSRARASKPALESPALPTRAKVASSASIAGSVPRPNPAITAAPPIALPLVSASGSAA